MSNWAEIDNNIVLRVIACDNNEPDEGYQLLIDNFGGTWIKTSYNTLKGIHLLGGVPLRKNFAGIGYSYSQSLDGFIPPKIFDSLVLNEETCQWETPIPYPTDGKHYTWNEATTSWVEIIMV